MDNKEATLLPPDAFMSRKMHKNELSALEELFLIPFARSQAGLRAYL